MFEQDGDQFPIKCPACDEEFYEQVGRIKAGLDTRCPKCKARITHPTEQFHRILEDINGARPDYFRRFMQLKMPK